MQGDLIVVAIGLAIALAFSTLIKAFTDNLITPLVNAAGGGGVTGLGVHGKGHLLNFGAFVSAVIPEFDSRWARVGHVWPVVAGDCAVLPACRRVSTSGRLLRRDRAR